MFFFFWNFFCLGLIEKGEGLGNYQKKIFPEIFFRGGVLEMREKNFPENIYRTVCPKPAIKNPLGGGGDIGGGGCRWYSPPLSRLIT